MCELLSLNQNCGFTKSTEVLYLNRKVLDRASEVNQGTV